MELSVVTIAMSCASQQVKWNVPFCQLGKDPNAYRPAMTNHYPNDHPDEKTFCKTNETPHKISSHHDSASSNSNV